MWFAFAYHISSDKKLVLDLTDKQLYSLYTVATKQQHGGKDWFRFALIVYIVKMLSFVVLYVHTVNCTYITSTHNLALPSKYDFILHHKMKTFGIKL